LRRPALDNVDENGSFRIGQHNFGLGGAARKETAEPSQRSARTGPTNHGVDIVIHLRPNFRRRAGFVGERIGRIAELIDENGARRVGRDASREILIILGVTLADVRTGRDHFGPHGLEVQHLLAAHLVGNDQDQSVALERRHQGKPQTGIAGGRLDQGATGSQLSFALERGDHGERGAILDRATGVLTFQFDKQPAVANFKTRDLDQRRVPDELEHALRWSKTTARRCVGQRCHGARPDRPAAPRERCTFPSSQPSVCKAFRGSTCLPRSELG
jgi:hypothetical protein